VEYQNLDLWVERQPSGSYLVQGKSAQGDYRDQSVTDLSAIVFDRDGIAECRVNGAALSTLGQQLFDFLFKTGTDARLTTLLDRSLGATSQAEQGLRIRLQLDEANADVASMPWEFLYRGVDKRFMACQIVTPIVRFLEVPIPLRRMEAKLPLSMLVVIPAADDLNVDLEVSLLEEALGSMKGAVNMEVLRGIVTPAGLREELGKRDYDILHFVGHGDFDETKATLRFNDEAGRPRPLDHETLGKLIANEQSLRLVVLNSCKGAALSSTTAFLGMAPRLVEAGVPAVVAMQFPIRDDEALCFVKAFYGALFGGEDRGSVDVAIGHARTALEMDFAGTRAFGVPAVFVRYDEGVLFRVVTDSVLRDSILAPPRDVARDKALIREIEANRRRVDATDGGAPEHQAVLADRLDELTRAKRRVRLRTWSILTGVLVALVAALAFAVNLLNRVPLSWLLAASPVWFGDPRAGAIGFADSIQFTTTSLDSAALLQLRPSYAALVDKLSDAGARVIVFDVFFRTPRPAEDIVLAQAFARARRKGTGVVFGTLDLVGGKPNVVPALAATASVGGVCLGENKALFPGIVPLFTWGEEEDVATVPSLALAAAAAWRQARVMVDVREVGASLVDKTGRVIDRVRPTRERTVSFLPPDCPMIAPGSRYAELLATRVPVEKWRDPLRQHDLFTVVQSSPEQLGWARGKAVMVGAYTAGELSRRRTGFRTDERYGVERQADALATILSDAELAPLGGLGQLVVIGLGSAIGAWTAFRSTRGRRRRDLAVAGGAMAGFFLLATIAYWSAGKLVDILYPAVALGLSYGIVLVLKKRWQP
jgi:hypothetical protein